jgi:hypothetical protein
MKRLVATTYLMIALTGPSLAQDVAAVGKKAKPKQSSECRPVGTVKGTKLGLEIVSPPSRWQRQWQDQNQSRKPRARSEEVRSSVRCLR